jgi:tetratricopeptide (TPR) repeat protein
MNYRALPTESPEALMNFVQGRNALDAYLGSGRSEDLERARQSFSAAHQDDPAFELASFYLAVASTELRDSATALEILRWLTGHQIDFLPEALLQLAYAYTKTYDSSLFLEAERALDRAVEEAQRRSRDDLVAIIQAYRVFLFAVMGGRYDDKAARPRYVLRAIALGERLLTDPATLRHPGRDQILFELHNALGIAYWRKGQNDPAFGKSQEASWGAAREHFGEALRIRPNGTRTLQNQGSLFLSEGDQFARAGEIKSATESYAAAQRAYLASLALNPIDQFPHYRMSELAARLGEWETAEWYFERGKKQPGEVKLSDWERLANAIRRRDASELLAFR